MRLATSSPAASHRHRRPTKAQALAAAPRVHRDEDRAPFLTSQPLLNLLLGIRLRYASWGAPVAHWWPRVAPRRKRAEVIDAPKPETDLRTRKDHLVVTTASVPWLTGTGHQPFTSGAPGASATGGPGLSIFTMAGARKTERGLRGHGAL